MRWRCSAAAFSAKPENVYAFRDFGTVGGDNDFDTQDFVAEMPSHEHHVHVAQNESRRDLADANHGSAPSVQPV
jgi:hypothetical protein